MTGFRGRERRKAQPVPDHQHPDYWTEMDHERFEDRVSAELRGLGMRVDQLATRLTLLLGGLGLVAFLLPILAPFIRGALGLDIPPLPVVPATPTP